MRHVIVSSHYDESIVNASAARTRGLHADRIIILSPRRGEAFETGSVLDIPLRWASTRVDLLGRLQRRLVRPAVARVAGLRAARLLGWVEDLLLNIDASDPDIIDLRRLGALGQWLGPKCSLRFPGRRVLTGAESCEYDKDDTRWRTYDPTALVSVILPVYNGEKYLALSIESCLNQTHKNFELIIVDDGSQDNTQAIIRKYATLDRRIRHVRNDPNQGLPESLNVGFRLARGRFMTWTSDDNLYTSIAIEYMAQQLCTFSNISLVYCSFHL